MATPAIRIDGQRRPGRSLALVIALAIALLAAACTDDGTSSTPATTTPAASSGGVSLVALSTRPEYVTGGDVLVAIEAPAGTDLAGARLTRDGVDVSSALRPDGDRAVALVDGLQLGGNRLEATVGATTVDLTVVDHPTTGPLFSGPLSEPLVCTTEANGLGPPTDGDCSAPTQVATREVAPGVTATVEKGVLGRSAYTMAVPSQGWNQRLVYRFGGGCGAGHSQGSDLATAADPSLLGAGYAVATSTLNTFQTACNDVVSAEVALIVKEHFIEAYGVPRFTIGEGGSGGAIQQLLIAQDEPGILDGIIPVVPFPDAVSIAGGVTDCGLLLAYYATPAGQALTPAQRQAVNGHRTTGTCEMWDRTFVPLVRPTATCDPAIPANQLFDPTANPDGVRCTLQDSNVNQLGRDPATGFARRPLDNVGVEYGRQALLDGVIDGQQFLALNQGIGGYDVNGAIVGTRTTATEDDVQPAYTGGRINQGAGGLADVPIVLVNVYTDDIGDIHDRQRVFAIRERLTRGSTGVRPANVVIITRPGSGDLLETLTGAVSGTTALVQVVDQWLTAAGDDPRDVPWPVKLDEDRPPTATDTCVTPGGEVLTGPSTYDGANACTLAYPVGGDPRRVAGAPLAGDIVKCTLTGIDEADYGGKLTADQLDQLGQVFPDGVCDWMAPGVGEAPFAGTWQSYG